MAEPLTWTAAEQSGCAVVAVHGRLDLAATPHLFVAFQKCLAEQPRALLADLAGMSLGEVPALAVFTAINRQAAAWPGTPVLLCAPRPEVADPLGHRRFGALQVRADVGAAVRETDQNGADAPTISDRLVPVAGSARLARHLVTEACVRWELPDLAGPAAIVAGELVANAVEHAGTMITLQLVRRARYVHVVVRDGSPRTPVIMHRAPDDPARGRGLMLVDSLAVRWGTLPTRDGKVVWATLTA
ncbi:ATP-binding protein [Actinoplanes sp. HUAS TT8]|uniref:ATP-binding protein n=1 Tax=Actinoplanes sp. HUAS TT8 TaxID=3447453 RepID=UPI003F51C69D